MSRRPLDPATSASMTPERWQAVKRLFDEVLPRNRRPRDLPRCLLSLHGGIDAALAARTGETSSARRPQPWIRSSLLLGLSPLQHLPYARGGVRVALKVH